jgi:hypothetical protein
MHILIFLYIISRKQLRARWIEAVEAVEALASAFLMFRLKSLRAWIDLNIRDN